MQYESQGRSVLSTTALSSFVSVQKRDLTTRLLNRIIRQAYTRVNRRHGSEQNEVLLVLEHTHTQMTTAVQPLQPLWWLESVPE